MSIISELTSSGVGALMSGVGTLAKDLREAITGDLPADKRAEIEQKIMEIELASAQAQTKINEIEAASEHWFVAAWRPAVGWTGAMALFYCAILEPLMTWVAKACGNAAEFPALDTTITMQVLFAILGVGAFRSYDKKQAPAPAGKE